MIASFFFLGSALASSPAALGIPNHGGGFAGPTQPGVYGLNYTPTAALSASGEILVDTAIIRSNFSIQLDGKDPHPRTGVTPLPSLAALVPLHERVGLGLTLGVPYARLGSGDEDGPFRMWTIEGGIILAEARGSLAVQVHDKWTLGLGARFGYSIFNSFVAMDTGALMYQMYGSPADELIGDPLLEGTREISNGSGSGWGFTLGARFEPIPDVVFVASYASALSTPLSAQMDMTPSNDLALLLRAELEGDWSYPEEFNVGLSLPVGAVMLHANAEYIGWGSVSTTLANINDAYVVSEDSFLTGVLGAYGLNDPASLGDFDTQSYSGMQNILTGGLGVTWDPHPAWTALAAVHYTPGAIRDEYISPANVDFEGMDYRIGSQWRPHESWELAATLDVWVMTPRNITTSVADVYNESPLPNTPNANGDYRLGLQRLGLSSVYRF